uniref:hypothetical protein n=1 Tax=Chamaesiphon sp. OTE_75_metabat_556 TaxID=2964692 RepID=UPI00286A8375
GSQTRSRRTDFSQIDKTGDIQKVQPAITVMARRLDPKRSKMDKVELRRLTRSDALTLVKSALLN